MAHMGTDVGQSTPPRVDWVDYAKGFCIIMVVMMHSTLGVEAAAGRESWMHALVAFAKPFRMPDFFLISGLFLARVIDRDWRTYLDRKVVHFAYFYLLWVTIQFAFKAPGLAAEHGALGVVKLYAEAFVEPFGTLWFIYLLPIFFVVTKLTRSVPVDRDLADRGRARDRADRNRLDRDRRVRGALRLFLHRLCAGDAHLRARGRRAGAAAASPAGCSSSGRSSTASTCSPGSPTSRSSRSALGLIGAAAVVAVSALMAKSDVFAALRYSRAELDRGLSGVLPRHGGLARRAAQDRARARHGRAAGHRIGHRRRGRAVLGGAPHAAALPVRAAGLGAARTQPKYALQPAE